MNKFANVQEAAKANLGIAKDHQRNTRWPEDLDLTNLPSDFIDLLYTLNSIYTYDVNTTGSIFAKDIPEWDSEAITLPDALYHFLMTMAARGFRQM